MEKKITPNFATVIDKVIEQLLPSENKNIIDFDKKKTLL